MGRARTLRQDVQRKISQLRHDCSASSLESLQHEDAVIQFREDELDRRDAPQAVLCRARALVDCTPSPYDKEALRFKVRHDCFIFIPTFFSPLCKLEASCLRHG